MRRGTTPTITVTVDKDLTGMVIHLAFKTDHMLLVKTNKDFDISYEDGKTVIACKLTQEETLAMGRDVSCKLGDPKSDKCEVQIRAVQNNGKTAIATTIGMMSVARILEDGVIYG